jgi:hypothetical protein
MLSLFYALYNSHGHALRHSKLAVFTNPLVTASNSRRSPPSKFLNCPHAQLQQLSPDSPTFKLNLYCYRWSVSQFILVSGPNFVWQFLSSFRLHVGSPLWREDGSVICSAISHWLESHRTHNHILLSHLRLPQPKGPSPHIYNTRNRVAQLYHLGTGFPFRHLLRLSRLWQRYSNPPPHKVIISQHRAYRKHLSQQFYCCITQPCRKHLFK